MAKETNPFAYGLIQKKIRLVEQLHDYCIDVADPIGLWLCPFCSRLTLPKSHITVS